MYINDLQNCLSDFESHLNADDVQLHLKCEPLKISEFIGRQNDALVAV